jgi:hypothetical protein
MRLPNPLPFGMQDTSPGRKLGARDSTLWLLSFYDTQKRLKRLVQIVRVREVLNQGSQFGLFRTLPKQNTF